MIAAVRRPLQPLLLPLLPRPHVHLPFIPRNLPGPEDTGFQSSEAEPLAPSPCAPRKQDGTGVRSLLPLPGPSSGFCL